MIYTLTTTYATSATPRYMTQKYPPHEKQTPGGWQGVAAKNPQQTPSHLERKRNGLQ